MTLSRNINSFADVKAVLEAVLAAGGGTYRLPTKSKANYWVMRAYQFRKLLQASVKGEPTPYDRMVMRRRGNEIEFDLNPGAEGTLLSPEGEEVPIRQPSLTPITSPKVSSKANKLDLTNLAGTAELLLKEQSADDD